MPIIMFHYVKTNSNYYHYDLNIFESFVKQNKDNIVSLTEYLKADSDSKYVLSFDDGTIDHYNNVFPILKKYNVTGVFSVCDNVFNNKILNIQKIHYLIENCGVDLVYEKLCVFLSENQIKKFSEKFKTKENFIKKVLQQSLSIRKSKSLLNKIAKQIGINFKNLNLYLDKVKIKEMQNYGNEFLYHTKNHLWLGELTYKRQFEEIKNIKNYLKRYGFLNVLSLPFGSYNKETLIICEKLHIDKLLGIDYNKIESDSLITREDCKIYS